MSMIFDLLDSVGLHTFNWTYVVVWSVILLAMLALAIVGFVKLRKNWKLSSFAMMLTGIGVSAFSISVLADQISVTMFK